MKTTKPKPVFIAVELRPHRSLPSTHTLVRVTYRGHVYAATWARPCPARNSPESLDFIEDVRTVWRDERSTFQPYDESAGCYVDAARPAPLPRSQQFAPKGRRS